MDSIDNLGGWLTAVVVRVCLDMLRSRSLPHEESMKPDRLTSGPDLCIRSRMRGTDGRLSRARASRRSRPSQPSRATCLRLA